ncbi:hypothetical protein ACFP65_05080 [Marinilactibacillus sp. GCM10026970]|uniref:hypothetical protein n=1 Tax=Marinilactibacillus sp. GCM10026970 TaxID=3252642 RepID=UPI00360FE089
MNSNKKDMLLTELSRFESQGKYFNWKLIKIAESSIIDCLVLIIVGNILVLVQGGNVNFIESMMILISYFSLITVYSFLIIWTKLYFGTSKWIFTIFFLLDAYNMINIGANQYLNPFAGIHQKFSFYEAPTYSTLAPDPNYYSVQSFIAFFVAMITITIAILLTTSFKTRKVEI